MYVVRHLARVTLGHLCVRALDGNVLMPSHAPKFQRPRQVRRAGGNAPALVQWRPEMRRLSGRHANNTAIISCKT